MSTEAIRVVIADDHPVVRDGVRLMLEADQGLRIVGVASSFDAALDQVSAQPVDVLVLDLHGMRGSALGTVRELRRSHPQTAIVVFSSKVDLAPEMIQAGVTGYVIKEEIAQQLIAAIRSAARGKPFYSRMVAEYMAWSDDVRQDHHLTPRELQVLKLLAQGLRTEAIAQETGLDPRSVQNYITTLRRKTGSEERVQLADWYRRLGPPDDVG